MIDKKVQAIVDYLKNSEKADFLIGAELEYFIVDKHLNSISYYDDLGIESLLNTLSQNGFSAVCEGENIIGVQNDELYITLEPGAQWEISLKPQKNVDILEQNYLNFMQVLEPILESRNQFLHSSGYLPKNRIDEIRFIPKERYKFMSEYLGKTGKYAHNMMKGTASIQVAIDFRNEHDFVRKMRLACRLTPIFSAVFDNSKTFEGKSYENFALRTLIWSNCDDHRCGIIPQVFDNDFGYAKYAEYILNLIPILINKNGRTLPFNKPFSDFYDVTANILDQLNHIFSMCFPDVRARNYIELRMTDSLPYPLNFAFVELIDLMFNEDSIFEEIGKILATITLDEINLVKEKIINNGIKAEYLGKPIIYYFQRIMEKLPDGKYQKLLKRIAEKELIPRELEQIGGKLASADI